MHTEQNSDVWSQINLIREEIEQLYGSAESSVESIREDRER